MKRSSHYQRQAQADLELLEQAAAGDIEAIQLCYEIFEGWQPPEEEES